MPASANWPERTLISPILTVPCALADETPSRSATAQPSPTRFRFMIILPVLAAEQLQKIVLMKVCAVEKFGGRGRCALPLLRHCPVHPSLPDMTRHGQWPPGPALTKLPECGIHEVRRDLPRRRTWSPRACAFQIVADDRNR